MAKPWENAGDFRADPGDHYGHRLHYAHDCGFTLLHDWNDAPGFQAKVANHKAWCVWPDLPEPVETVSD